MSCPLIAHTDFFLAILVFAIAALYSSVGHGGASGYLAVLSLWGFSASEMSASALALNIVVAGIAWWSYSRSGHFSWLGTWPFILLSVPAAALGGMLDVPESWYKALLSFALIAAAVRMTLPRCYQKNEGETRFVHNGIKVLSGGIIGLLSGIVGVGGGIFLSPIMLLLRWADIKTVSATAACFVVVNSVAGLLGRGSSGIEFLRTLGLVPVFAVAGGMLGSTFGSARSSRPALQRVLAVVLVIAAAKMASSLFT